MAKTIYKGQKTKFAANIGGIGNTPITDDSVDFILYFYVEGKAGQVEIKKSDCTFDGSTAMFLLDVTALPTGPMSAFAEVTYREDGFDEDIRDKVAVRLDTQYFVAEPPVTAE